MKKAAKPQGKKGVPFLIALDVQDLPGAFRELPIAILGYLPQWTAVSGILLFLDMMASTKCGWHWRLIQNPHATTSLPESLAARARFEATAETSLPLVVAVASDEPNQDLQPTGNLPR